MQSPDPNQLAPSSLFERKFTVGPHLVLSLKYSHPVKHSKGPLRIGGLWLDTLRVLCLK